MASSAQLVEASKITVNYLSLDTPEAGVRSALFEVSGQGPTEPKGQGAVTFSSDPSDPFSISVCYSGPDMPDQTPRWSVTRVFRTELAADHNDNSLVLVTVFNPQKQGPEQLRFDLFPGSGSTIGDAGNNPI